jgi:hypothetical protein
MARRRRQSTFGFWGVVGVTLLAVLVAWWWFAPRRAESPALPASVPGGRVIAAPPDAEHHEEITGEEKGELDRVLRERSGDAAR